MAVVDSGLVPELAPYAGRWVVLVEGQVAGVGFTALEAERLARRNRPRVKVWETVFVEPAGGEPLLFPPLLEELLPILSRQEWPVYLVGGAVRDGILGRESYDLDFVVPQKGVRLAFKVANALGVPAFALDKERDVGRVMLAEMTLDFARFRGDTLLGDLADRDFTMNALAIPAGATTTASLIDPTNGYEAIGAGEVRLTSSQALATDPVRCLRALRMALRFGFVLPPETQQAIVAARAGLTETSTERVRDELLKLLLLDKPNQAVRWLHELGLLPLVLPEVAEVVGVAQSAPHFEPVFEHTLRVLRWLVLVEAAVVQGEVVSEGPLVGAQTGLAAYREALVGHLGRRVDGGLSGRVLLRLGALLHDVGKAKTQTEEPSGRIRFFGHDKVGAKLAGGRLRAFHLSNEAVKHGQGIVAGHMRPLMLLNERSVSRRAIFRFFRAVGLAGVDIGLLALADHLATHRGAGGGDAWERLVALVGRLFEMYFEQYEAVVNPVPLLSGRELMDRLHIRPGPEVGRLLRLLVEAQAAGEVTTQEEAVVLVERSRQ